MSPFLFQSILHAPPNEVVHEPLASIGMIVLAHQHDIVPAVGHSPARMPAQTIGPTRMPLTFRFMFLVSTSSTTSASRKALSVPKPPGSMNTYGSEGPARVDIPGGIILLPLGTRIQLNSLGGNIVSCGLPATVLSETGDDAESLTVNWLGQFIKEVRVPDDCISFSWARDGSGGYVVSVLFHPLTAERHDELTWTTEFNDVCWVCAGPCDEASSFSESERNCIVCLPFLLCDRCRVKTGSGSYKCYGCLSDEEWAEAQENCPTQQLRMSLLECARPG